MGTWQFAGEELTLNRAERATAVRVQIWMTLDKVLGNGRQLSDGLVQEKLLGCHPKSRGQSAADHLQTENGITAQLEKVIVDADPLDTVEQGVLLVGAPGASGDDGRVYLFFGQDLGL